MLFHSNSANLSAIKNGAVAGDLFLSVCLSFSNQTCDCPFSILVIISCLMLCFYYFTKTFLYPFVCVEAPCRSTHLGTGAEASVLSYGGENSGLKSQKLASTASAEMCAESVQVKILHTKHVSTEASVSAESFDTRSSGIQVFL